MKQPLTLLSQRVGVGRGMVKRRVRQRDSVGGECYAASGEGMKMSKKGRYFVSAVVVLLIGAHGVYRFAAGGTRCR